MPPYRILARGPWAPGEVSSRIVPSTRTSTPALDADIDRSWDAAIAAASASGKSLFDGPMLRLESFYATPSHLALTLSPTSYKAFYILHMLRPDLLAAHTKATLPTAPPPAAPYPLGVSACVLTSDRKLLLGQRSARVAYYPHRLHPFAGPLEPADAGDPFTAARRELHEELALAPHEISNLQLLALAEDSTLQQPEALLSCQTPLSAEQVRARLDPHEHDALVALDASLALPDPDRCTPVALATLACLSPEIR
jgi:8-oxo-dGTP pyrophosphatase MutT (NUDIX family)